MKEKDYIDELVLKNLEALSNEEPLEGHFERFEDRLKKQSKKKFITFNVVWKVAAAVIFVLLATNQAFIYLSPNNEGSFFSAFNSNEVTLSTVSSEYEEVEFYYTNSISTGINQWNSFVEKGFISEEEQQVMDEELLEFEDLYKSLQSDLEANPNDERVVNAMLEYYQAKLNVINLIVNKLKEVEQTNKNHENEI